MHGFHDMPIRRKLILVFLLTSSAAVLLACLSFVAADLVVFRRSLARNITVLADGIGNNATAALAFDDAAGAAEILAALKVEPNIVAACLYDNEGTPFAEHRRDKTRVDFPARAPAPGYRFERDRLVVVRTVLLNNRPVGVIYVHSSLDSFYERSRFFACITLAIMIGALLVAYALSFILQRIVSEPILSLAGTAQVVSEKKDYSVRAPPAGSDEIGRLTAAFNEMLASIEEREAALRHAYDSLLQEIADRRRAETQLQRQGALLRSINMVFLEALTCRTAEEVAQKGLVVAQELTGSKFGLVGEINPAGCIDVVALTDPGWTACQMPNPKLALRNMKIHGIYGAAIKQRRSLITNDPPSHPDWIGIPEGHPALNSFLGVPLMQDEKAIGLIGLANKQGGFDEADQRDVEALSVALLEALKRKRAEEELRALNITLEQRVAERTALAEHRARELARSNAELQQFAYVASHDLQEPLRMVGSYTQLLARRYEGRLDKDADEFIHYAVDGALRMQTLINDLLAFARVDSRGRPFKTTDGATVLDNVLANLKVAITEAGASITHDPLPQIVADETQLIQLFQNLIGNALKFRRNNAPPRIHIGASAKDGHWEFFVRDNGIGIAPEHFDRIFQIFQRLHTRVQYAGTGIGLAVCKKIVERHGGRIWVESQPGQGATFHFTLPRKPAQPA